MTFSISKTRELCDAATEGPYSITGRHLLGTGVFTGDDVLTYGPLITCWSGGDVGAEKAEANAAFIAHARTALPQALDEIERLTRERDEAVGLLRENSRWVDPLAWNVCHGPDLRALNERTAAFLSRHKEG